MEWIMWLCAGIVALGVFISFLTIHIELTYRRKDESDSLLITLSLLRKGIRFKRKFPLHSEALREDERHTSDQHKNRSPRDKTAHMKQGLFPFHLGLKDLYIILSAFLANVHCDRLEWRSTVGTGDAAEAGLLMGMLWTVKTMLLGWLSRSLQMETVPQLTVTPAFNSPRLETSFHCILHFRLGHAIFTAIRVFVHVLREKRHSFNIDTAEETA